MSDAVDPRKIILIVDDDPSIRKILSDILSKDESYLVHTVGDGQAAIDWLEEHRYQAHMVLTDMQMPRVSGEELIATVAPDHPEIAFLVLTAFRNDKNVVRCMSLGALDYVVKPIKIKDFLAVVRRVLSRHDRFGGKGEDFRVRSDLDGWVELTAPTDFEYVERFRAFTSLLGHTSFTQEMRNDIQIAIDELGQNAVEWGNLNDRSKKIHLSYCLFDDRLVFKIEDEGEGFMIETLRDPSQDPIAHIQKRAEEGKRPGGYGVFISRKVMDDVTFNESGNIVLLTKFLRQRTPRNPS